MPKKKYCRYSKKGVCLRDQDNKCDGSLNITALCDASHPDDLPELIVKFVYKNKEYGTKS